MEAETTESLLETVVEATETTMEAETTDKSNEELKEDTVPIHSLLNQCASCKENFQNKEAKLLACLHTVCNTCLPNLIVGVTQPTDTGEQGCQLAKCPMCSQEGAENTVIDNLFANTTVVPSADKVEAEETKICTCCEDNENATSYCQECEEYLCDQCVQAHKRVKVTKDHTIQPKDSVEPSGGTDQIHKHMNCPVHKQEQLKLYCETCEKLTCRDCQLLEHKDHKYQFVDEAALQYKANLQLLLEKIRDKKAFVENAKSLIGKRNDEITEKEQRVASDIRTFIMKVATELNKRGKQLMMDLQSICKAKKGQLEKKNKEVCGLSETLNHTLAFADFCLEKNNDAALLYTKKILNSQMRGILKSKCEVPNPYHVIDLKFGYDPKTPLIQIPSLGNIFVEGIPFNPANPISLQPPSQQQQSSHSNQQQQSSSTASSQPQAANNVAKIPGTSPQGSRPPHLHEELSSAVSQQQKALFMMKVKKVQEQRQIAQQQHQQQHQQQQFLQHQQQQQLQQQQQQQQMYKHIQQATSPSSSSSCLQMMNQYNMPQSHTQRLSHLPHQSSYISSSNSQNQRPQQPQQQPYYPPPLKGPHPIQGHMQQPLRADQEALIKINLSQLQERRVQHQQHQGHSPYLHHQGPSTATQPQPSPQQQHSSPAMGHNNYSQSNPPTNNMQNPIVIQPTADYSPDSALNPLVQQPKNPTLSDCMHSDSNRQMPETRSRAMKPEEVVRPSCSFANSNNLRLKPEPRTPQETDIIPNFGALSSGSRTPTPRAESSCPAISGPETMNIIPDLDSLANISTGSNSSGSVSDQLTAILGSDLSSTAASEKIIETILGLSGDETTKKTNTTSATTATTITTAATASPTVSSQTSSKLSLPKNRKEPATKTGKTVSPARQSSQRSQREDDPSEDWCAVCHNGGDLLCCDGCPKVFHLTCHVPVLPVAPSDDWFCGLCTKEDDLKLTSAEVKDDQSKLGPKEKKICERILLELFSHDESPPFHDPVPETVPNYYKIISRPIDLGTTKKKLAEDQYKTLEDVLKDIQLIFSNCSTYNLKESDVGRAGKIVEDFYHLQLARYVPYIEDASLMPPSEETLDLDTLPDLDPVLTPDPVTNGNSRKRTKSHDTVADDDDEEWVADEHTTGEEDSEDVVPKKRIKRKRNSHSTDGSTTSEQSIVHVR